MEDLDHLKVLLVGNGGREHALAWKLSQSTRVECIWVAPGNGGTAKGLAKVQNVAIGVEDFPALMGFAKEKKVNIVVPGPEVPLVGGIEAACRAAGLRCFGPSKAAAQMEGSKAYAKDFMTRYKIPTARYESFSNFDKAKAYLDAADWKVVLKASGLAAGKGVIIPSSKEEADSALRDIMLNKEFGSAGDEVVIEEFLEGAELSILSFCDGYTIRSLPPAQDHKQINDGDTGPMTGGMGCYAPTTIATPELVDEIHRTILQPTIDGMRKDRAPMVGMLFTGLMITTAGPRVLEYNVRFGDPETETVLPLLSPETDLAAIMLACTDRYLDTMSLSIASGYSCTVIVVAGGYPGKYAKGKPITISDPSTSTTVFHAGTSLSAEDQLLTAGGRVLAVTSTASSLESAIAGAYVGVSMVNFSGMYFRRDIGHRALVPFKFTSAPSTIGLTPLTYASTGVSISSGNDLVHKIKPLVSSTSRPGSTGSIGGFGGTFSLVEAGYPMTSPTLLLAIDGVGTKLFLAHQLNKHDTVGIDCVAMNANDLAVQGAEVLAFLDIYTTSKLDVDVAVSFVSGVAEGCRRAGCVLAGGETAEMPGLLREGIGYDAGGAAVGAIPSGQPILPLKDSMKAGDVVLGLASDGMHSNGFSLVRKILSRAGVQFHDRAPWGGIGSTGEQLLTPTRIYVKSLVTLAKDNLMKGAAHITGGGLLENIPRMLPKHLAAEIDARKWDCPKEMKWLKTTGGIEDEEFARVFNTGLGIVLVVAEENAARAVLELAEKGENVWEVGKLRDRRDGDGEGCTVVNMAVWNA